MRASRCAVLRGQRARRVADLSVGAGPVTLDPLKRVASRACSSYRQVLSWGIEALHRAIIDG
jgi:hypothetical protein